MIEILLTSIVLKFMCYVIPMIYWVKLGYECDEPFYVVIALIPLVNLSYMFIMSTIQLSEIVFDWIRGR